MAPHLMRASHLMVMPAIALMILPQMKTVCLHYLAQICMFLEETRVAVWASVYLVSAEPDLWLLGNKLPASGPA